jgi:hypothetical protein
MTHRYIYIRCPASLIDDANHLVNCFESCFPSIPVLQIREGQDFAQIIVPCRESWWEGVRAIIAGAPLQEPSWNSESEAGWLVDMDKARNLLRDHVALYVEGEIPADKFVISEGPLG